MKSKMNKVKIVSILLISIIFLFPKNIKACSSFFFNYDNKLLAKNFDWYSGKGLIIKNIRHQQKYAYGFHGENVAKWTSKYGSITFNQIGKEFPYGGINEKGLVIEQLWFEKSEYQNNHNNEISELEWIQYQLDNYSSIDEVIENIKDLTIKPIATIHYILADKTGNSAVIEFINGKTVITKGNTKTQVITNESVHESKEYYDSNNVINSNSRMHLDRYCILQNNLKKQNLEPLDAFKKLKLVAENREDYKTYWSIVYDIDNLEVYFKSKDQQNIKRFSLTDLNFENTTEYSKINSKKINFNKYSEKRNNELLSSAMKMMNIEINEELANKHQMNPNKIVTDSVFLNTYTNLFVKFITKSKKGKIYYSFINGAENFKNYEGFKMGIIPVQSKVTRKVFYNFPKIDFALACFQDLNNDSKMEKNILGIPTKTGFSNNKKKIFGIPPNYKTAKINLDKEMLIKVKIK